MDSRINRRPIFINGFTRGGTTLLLNLLLSHPELCAPAFETHHAFRGFGPIDNSLRIFIKWIGNELPLFPTLTPHAFSPRRFGNRPVLSARAERHIDRVLYREKLRARHARLNRYLRRDTPYTDAEIASARLVAKNVDGIVYFTDALARMYPDAVFLGLVRNGLALCEGHVRRGAPADAYGHVYQGMIDRMLADAARIPAYHVLRFEDLLADPHAFIVRLYLLSGVDPALVREFRLERVADPFRGPQRGDGPLVWVGAEQLREAVDCDADRKQIARLSEADRMLFLSTAGGAMRRLGYA